jgi:hypothetical protein
LDPAGPLRSILQSLKDRQEYLDAEVPLPHLKRTDEVKPYVTPHFRVGDIVTRGGTDRHRVISTNGDDECAPDMIEIECIKEPVVEYCDGTFGEAWIRVGEREFSLADRYDYVGKET